MEWGSDTISDPPNRIIKCTFHILRSFLPKVLTLNLPQRSHQDEMFWYILSLYSQLCIFIVAILYTISRDTGPGYMEIRKNYKDA